MVYCTARFNDKNVFVELTHGQVYGERSEIVAVFEERQGELVMHEARIEDLKEIEPE